MNFKLVTAPTTTPVSLATVKEHLRLPASYTSEDTVISMYLDAAVKMAEDRTNRCLMEQTWRISYDRFPLEFLINKTPLIAVSHIKYVNSAGVLTTLSSSDYLVDADSEPWRIQPAYQKSFPICRLQNNSVTVTFTAGYASASAIPKNIIAAILLIVDDLWKNRGTIVTGTIVSQIPITAEKLLESERVIYL